MEILVQIWGPVSGATNCYDWITVGKINNPASIDIDYLKPMALDIIGHSNYKPFLNAARLKMLNDGKTEMQVTVTDMW